MLKKTSILQNFESFKLSINLILEIDNNYSIIIITIKILVMTKNHNFQSGHSNLWLDIEYSKKSTGMNLSDRVQFGPIHGILVGAILEVFVGCDVGHHLFVGDEEVVPAVFLILFRGPSGVWIRRWWIGG